MASGWREQYDRMLRWRERLAEPMRPDESREHYNTRIADYLHAFFVTCYHVSDALKADPRAGKARARAMSYAVSATWLSKCHGIALGSKHVIISRGPRRGSRPKIVAGTTTRSETLYGVPGRHGTRTFPDSFFNIEIDGQVHQAIPAADECIREWEDFLRRKGLQP